MSYLTIQQPTALALTATLLMTLLSSLPATAGNQADFCHGATTVDIGVTPIRGDEAHTTIYRLPIPARGGIALDAVTSIADPEHVRLERIDARCPDTVRRLSVLHEAPQSLVLRAHNPGAVYFKVASKNPAMAFEGAELHVAFTAEPENPNAEWTLDANPPATCASSDLPSIDVPSSTPSDGNYILVRRETNLTKDVEPEDCDVLERTFSEPGVVILESEGTPVDAALFTGGGCTTAIAKGGLGEAGQALVAPVFAGSHHIDLASGTSDLTYALAVKHLPLCPAGHGGLSRCAAVLDADVPIKGRLTAGQERAYTFVLETLSTVAVTVKGGPVDGALYDGQGIRLAARIACHDSGCGLVTTLPKGRFSLRLAGPNAEPVRYIVTLTHIR